MGHRPTRVRYRLPVVLLVTRSAPSAHAKDPSEHAEAYSYTQGAAQPAASQPACLLCKPCKYPLPVHLLTRARPPKDPSSDETGFPGPSLALPTAGPRIPESGPWQGPPEPTPGSRRA